MKLVTGVDILHIPRLKKSLQNPRFLSRVYGSREIEHYENSGKKVSFLAGSFCAKEAFSKALGTGVRGFSLAEVEVLHDTLGKPYFSFSGKAESLVSNAGLSFSLSISHETEYAIAFVTGWTVSNT